MIPWELSTFTRWFWRWAASSSVWLVEKWRIAATIANNISNAIAAGRATSRINALPASDRVMLPPQWKPRGYGGPIIGRLIFEPFWTFCLLRLAELAPTLLVDFDAVRFG